MKAKILFLIYACMLVVSPSKAQNRAPSCWLKYNDNFDGDILVTMLKVDTPSPLYTYNCALQWNPGAEAGGYCGFQEHPNGKNFIFSIWDPISSNDSIKAAYAMPTTIVENFGGEGTGLKSWNFDIGWQPENWYAFVTRAWNGNNNNTMFGYWIFDYTNTKWYHMVTMDFPVPNVKFSSTTGAFIEDWLGNGDKVRKVRHKDGWKRRSSNMDWYAFNTARFERVSPDPGAANYIDNYDGGILSNVYFMQSGGSTSPVSNTSPAQLLRTSTGNRPDYDTGAIISHNHSTNTNVLSMKWAIDSTKSPQFSYHLELYDNANYTGTPTFAQTVMKPHIRQEDFNIATLTNGATLYYKFFIKDIFDQPSNVVTGNFVAHTTGTSIDKIEGTSFEIYPNPVQNRFSIRCSDGSKNYTVAIYDMNGKLLEQQKSEGKETIIINTLEAATNGVYFVKIIQPDGGYTCNKLLKQ